MFLLYQEALDYARGVETGDDGRIEGELLLFFFLSPEDFEYEEEDGEEYLETIDNTRA